MKTAYFDCFAGIAGDMALGALLDCGIPLEALREALFSLPVEGWELETRPVLKSGIHGLQVRVALHGQSDVEEQQRVDESRHDHRHDETADATDHVSTSATHSHHPHHHHKHHYSHPHGHGEHEHHDHQHHDHDHHHGASMADIRDLIEKSTFSERVRRTSLAIFEKIAVAEAHQHHTTPDQVHFHEIGGVDSLLDICGVAWCLEYLDIDKIYASPLPLSTGFVDCAHGRMPVPAPAVMELMKGMPVYSSGLKGEMVTPTGAGILAALCEDFGEAPAMRITSVGCGSGTRDWPDRPNILRVTLGESESGGDKSTFTEDLEQQELAVLQTNIDDMNPQLYEDVCDELWRQGVLDVWLQPLQMKKNRPSVKLEVLCEPEKMDSVLKVLLLQTTSLGVRVQRVQRFSLARRIERLDTPLGEISVKLALGPDGEVLRAQPEYEIMRALARRHRMPLLNVERTAAAAIVSRWPQCCQTITEQ